MKKLSTRGGSSICRNGFRSDGLFRTMIESMTTNRRTFLKQAALGAAVLAYPSSKVLGANDRVRVGMIGVGDRGNDLLGSDREGSQC